MSDKDIKQDQDQEQKQSKYENKDLRVASVEDVKEQMRGEVVPIPGWNNDDINFRLRRPSITGLVRQGKIPNELLGVAEKAVKGDKQGQPKTPPKPPKDRDEDFDKLCDLLHLIAKEAIVEPRFDGLFDKLTDEQLFFIYFYVMQGVRGLKTFREQVRADTALRNQLQNLGKKTEQDNKSS